MIIRMQLRPGRLTLDDIRAVLREPFGVSLDPITQQEINANAASPAAGGLHPYLMRDVSLRRTVGAGWQPGVTRAATGEAP